MATTVTSTAPSSDEEKNLLKMSSAIVLSMNEQRQISNFTDCTIVVEGKVFLSHRFILSACSGFFRALFVSGMVEDKDRRVNIIGISQKTFSLILDCIFKAEIVLNTDNMIEVWHAANQLDISFLLKHCENFVANNISFKNCFDVYKNAKLLDCKRVENISWETILKDFNLLRSTEEILTLSFEEMKSLLESHYLNVTSEDHVIDLIMRWISFEEQNENGEYMHLELVEKDDFHEHQPVKQILLQNISLSRQNSASDEKEIDNYCLFDKTAECKETADGDIDIQNPKLNSEITVKNNSSICLDDQVSATDKEQNKGFSRAGHVAELLQASRYCHISGKAIEHLLNNSIILGNEAAMALIKESICYQLTSTRLIATAGNIYRASSKLKNVISWVNNSVLMCMSIEDKKVSQINLKRNISSTALAVCNNCINIVDNRFCYHFDYFWKVLVSTTEFSERYGHSITSVGEHIYLVGGNSLEVERMSVLGNDTWNSVGLLSTATEKSTVTVVGANIIILGCQVYGQDDTTVVQCFNTETMTSYRMNDIAGPPERIMTFNKDDQTFLLFKTGALWRLEVSKNGRISASYVTMLWDFDRDLNGAVLYRDQLYLFDSTFKDEKNSVWSISVPGVFEKVKNLCYEGFGFHNIVIPN